MYTSRIILIVGFLSLVVVLFALWLWPDSTATIDTVAAAGTDNCLECHNDKADYKKTAHFLTSTEPSAKTILGNFGPGENILNTTNPDLYFVMEARPDGFYQTSIDESDIPPTERTEKIDIVVGSGRKGQSYLFWHEGDLLHQSPVSWWRNKGSWGNSPGYRDGRARWSRRVAPRCLECHASYIRAITEDDPGKKIHKRPNQYDRSNYILGINCERCHTAGDNHVDGKDGSIINPTKLDRDREIEICQLCHGAGGGSSIQPPFSYEAGQPLAEYFKISEPKPDEPVDVHGNQVGLLKQSACYQASQMTCATCHNVHRPQRDLSSFNQTCNGCHQGLDRAVHEKVSEQKENSCVSCHMPLFKSSLNRDDGTSTTHTVVRTHRIAKYPNL